MRYLLQFDEDGDCWLKKESDPYFTRWEHPLQLVELLTGEDLLEGTTIVLEDYKIQKIVKGEFKDVETTSKS